MFTRLMLLATITCVGCAERNYLSAPVNGHGGTAAEKGVMSCEARFSASQLCVSLNWEKQATESEFGVFTFKTWRENALDGSPILQDAGGEVSVILWMPSMGHGSSPVTVERLDVGTYRAAQVFFSMGGDWEIRFQVNSAKGDKDQAILPIRF